MRIKRLLIANRGEIALRIMRTARQQGYSIVAVFTQQDREAAHVREADLKVYLPGETLSETYLNIEAVIRAAKETKADAIHPGYGFLSENPLFAEACEREGIIFVGPSSASIRAMGNKIAAREIARKHGVPVTPGITGSPNELLKNHSQVGFPVLIKAAAGGGGKGMRIVRTEDEMAAALSSTASEAANYFGDGTIYIERFFDGPRHIEVQILGDRQGNMVHLFERECSVQRRHQKIIEEAPSPTLTPAVREKICAAAVTLASSIGYYNAGTIEFLVDNDLNFYFLEMNTRIQVEHPVTELITGIDIVREQFRIAEGEPLSFRQKELSISGHAIEVRVYAEDPLNNFVPSPGTIYKYSYPEDNGIRMDDARLHDHSIVYSNFDPMISKVIAHGQHRDEAINKLTDFLPHYSVMGIKTNLSYLQMLLQHPDFRENRVHTRYIDNNQAELTSAYAAIKEKTDRIIPFTTALFSSLNPLRDAAGNKGPESILQEIGYWRVSKKISASIDNQLVELTLINHDRSSISFILSGESEPIQARVEDKGNGEYKLYYKGSAYDIYLVATASNTVLVKYSGHEFIFVRTDVAADDSKTLPGVALHKSDSGDMISPMPGRVLSVKVSEGDMVRKGELLIVIEAMKMENNILAPYDGNIDRILVKQGDNVDTSSILIHLSKAESVEA